MVATELQREGLAKARAAQAQKRQLAKLAEAGAIGTQTEAVTEEATIRDSQGRVQPVVTEADRQQGVQKATTTHRGPRFVWMYDRQGRGSLVPNHTIAVARDGGLMLECPHCHGDHENPEDPNGCPALPKLKFVQCRVCALNGRRKRIFDNLRGGDLVVAPTGDENEITLPGGDGGSTPEDRIRALYIRHMWTFHPTQAGAERLPVPADLTK